MKKVFSFAGPYLKQYLGRITALILLYIVVGVATMSIPYVIGKFVDALIEGSAAEWMADYVFVIASVGITQLTLGYVCERIYIYVQCRSGHALNADAIHHIQNIPYRYSQDRSATFLNQQINSDANAVVIFCITFLENVITNACTLLIPLALLTNMEPWLGLAVLVVNLAYFVLYHLLKGGVYRAQQEYLHEQADYFAKLGTQLSNVKFIQSHGLANSYIKRLGRSLEKMLHAAFRSQKAQYAFSSADVIVQYGASILVFFLGGYAVIRGKITAGEFTIVQSYFLMTLGATQYFFSLGKEIQGTRVSCERLQAIFDEPEQTNGTGTLTDIECISCENVSFCYDEDKVLSDRNETFEKGNIYAFVGENGAGKSTFINLLLGLFIDQYEGKVCYNGVPIEKLDMRTLRRELVGVSEQEPMLLEDTLRFNLTFDDQATVDEQEFQTLCGILNLDAFVRQLPNGLDTVVREGSTNLSGGEKQKISIIRALLKHPKLLVLDEPTSALDRESTRKFIDYLSGIRDDRIIFVSTHDERLLSVCTKTIALAKQ